MKKNYLIAIGVIISLLSLVLISAFAADSDMLEDKKLFTMINTNKIRPGGMGLTIAYASTKFEGKPTVFLGVDGLDLAKKRGKQDIFPPIKMKPRQIIAEILKKGGRVMVCSMCASAQGITKSDLMDGVEIIDAGTLFTEMFEDDDVRTLSFN